ncbi:uncharacterized protein LOC141652588 isoform X2 [Silene latifolia]|uniref:uncharacterized protein LOC141652588 isoform X2 n=1 Tax=Silene latifolia TaxID=37657 RepID=UPI003D77FF1A
MDEYRWNYHVPAFGSWDYNGNDELPYTQCFESARQVTAVGSLVRYGSYNSEAEDRDLYVAGDLYQNDVVTPAVIVVPRRMRKGGNHQNVKGRKKQQEMEKQEWGGYSYDIKEPPSPFISPHHKPNVYKKSKAVDQDLYQIPTEFYHVKPKRKRGFGLFSSCLQPTCV